MTGRQQAINQLAELTINRELDGGYNNISYDAPRVLTGDALEWWQSATIRQQKNAVYAMNANVKYYVGHRDDYQLWVCPAVSLKLIRDYYNNR